MKCAIKKKKESKKKAHESTRAGSKTTHRATLRQPQESTGQTKRGLAHEDARETAVVVKKPRADSVDLATQTEPVDECHAAEEKQVRRRRRKRSRGKGSRSNESVDAAATTSSAMLREVASNEAQRNIRLTLPVQDYSKWPKLKGSPSVGNCIAFKVRVWSPDLIIFCHMKWHGQPVYYLWLELEAQDLPTTKTDA